MAELTQEQINTMFQSDSRDCLGPRDPEVARTAMLQMGATEQEAEQTAQFWREHNRQWEESQRKAS